jgi:hypothetical protein
MGESPLSSSYRGGSYLGSSFKASSLMAAMGKMGVTDGLSTSPMGMATSPADGSSEMPVGSMKKGASMSSLTRRPSVGPKGLGGEMFELDGAEE